MHLSEVPKWVLRVRLLNYGTAAIHGPYLTLSNIFIICEELSTVWAFSHYQSTPAT